MGTSQFQFSNPMLLALEFHINDTYDADVSEINVDISINVNKERVNANEAVVELVMEIGERYDRAPFYVRAVEGAMFRWDDDAFASEQQIEDLLDVNAPSLLLSYLRPIVSSVTSMSKYPTYHIPFINFNKANRNE